ncbi:MAG: flagellar filament capping protein FliD, partial [Chloroflexota bacterium]
MSTTVSSSNLDSIYKTIILQTLEAERQPLRRLTTRRDEFSVQRAIYTDLNNLLGKLQTSLHNLLSSKPTYALNGGRSTQVIPAVSGSSVLTASAGSSAAPAGYEINVTSLARAHRVRSDAVEYSNQPLGMSGAIRLGGLADAALSAPLTGSGITGYQTAAPMDNQSALGRDTYSIETRQQDGAWQFRLVNSQGEAQSIRAAGGNYSSEWQATPLEPGWVDTGRGLRIEFDPAALAARTRSSGAASLVYTPQGALVSITEGDSLADVVSKINAAGYAEGSKVSATIVNNQLVLTNQRSGEGNSILAVDESGSVLHGLGILQGGAFKNVLQSAADALFTVNGVSVRRARNDGLTNVIHGVTLNLTPDAEGKSAQLSIEEDLAADARTVQSFLDQFNALQKYLAEKTATIKKDDGSYSRGSLAGDTMFRGLRMDMLRQMEMRYATGSAFTRLSDIGLKLDGDLKAVIGDRAALENALKNNRVGVKALLDAALGSLDARVNQFTGTSGYISGAQKAVDDQIDAAKKAIEAMNLRLAQREQSLIQQFAELQAQMTTMLYYQQQMNAIYGL